MNRRAKLTLCSWMLATTGVYADRAESEIKWFVDDQAIEIVAKNESYALPFPPWFGQVQVRDLESLGNGTTTNTVVIDLQDDGDEGLSSKIGLFEVFDGSRWSTEVFELGMRARFGSHCQPEKLLVTMTGDWPDDGPVAMQFVCGDSSTAQRNSPTGFVILLVGWQTDSGVGHVLYGAEAGPFDVQDRQAWPVSDQDLQAFIDQVRSDESFPFLTDESALN